MGQTKRADGRKICLLLLSGGLFDDVVLIISSSKNRKKNKTVLSYGKNVPTNDDEKREAYEMRRWCS